MGELKTLIYNEIKFITNQGHILRMTQIMRLPLYLKDIKGIIIEMSLCLGLLADGSTVNLILEDKYSSVIKEFLEEVSNRRTYNYKFYTALKFIKQILLEKNLSIRSIR